jgi:hypothetical protein
MSNNITGEELEMLEAATTGKDWDKAVDKIKENHGGYPSD